MLDIQTAVALGENAPKSILLIGLVLKVEIDLRFETRELDRFELIAGLRKLKSAGS
jgi:hypothetical protein